MRRLLSIGLLLIAQAPTRSDITPTVADSPVALMFDAETIEAMTARYDRLCWHDRCLPLADVLAEIETRGAPFVVDAR